MTRLQVNLCQKHRTWAEHGQNMGRTGAEHVLPMFCACSFHGNSMDNLLSYCGLIDAKTRASDNDLPVIMEQGFKSQRLPFHSCTLIRLWCFQECVPDHYIRFPGVDPVNIGKYYSKNLKWDQTHNLLTTVNGFSLTNLYYLWSF